MMDDMTALLKKEQGDDEQQQEYCEAVQLLGVAKNSLAKFYSPTTYKAPERRELTEEERIYVQSGGADPRDAEEAEAARTSIAGTGVTAMLQGRLGGPPPPPMAVEAYKKQD